MLGGPVLQLGLILILALTEALGQQPANATPNKSVSTPKLSQQPQLKPKPKDEPKIDPREIRLLKESYSASAALDANGRAILLEKLCNAAENIQNLAKEWCTETFQLAKDQLPAGDFRAHVQASAARAMSVHAPEKALAMLQDVDVTDAQSDERASCSRMIFEGVMHEKGANAFPELMAAAARLGETGSYPYMATTIMLYGGSVPHDLQEAASRHYSDSETELCNQVMQQGLTYFKKDSMNIRADFQFMTLLRSGSFSGCVSGWLMHQATTDFASELVKVGSAAINGDEKVKPHSARMLYTSAEHLLQEIDPVLAESVAKKIGEVKNLQDTKAPSTPNVKISNASWMSDPDARALYDKIGAAEGVLNNAPDGTTPHTPEMEAAIREGFAAAQRLVSKVEEIDPETAPAVRRGGANIPAFMDAAMRIWPETTIEQIEALPDGELKATLLITASEHIERTSEENFVLHRKPQ